MFEDFITALFGDSAALFIKCVWEKGGVSWEVNAEKWILWWQRENELRRRRRLHPLHMKSAISGSEKWSYSQHLDTPVVFSARVHQKVNSKHFILSRHKNQFHVFSEKLDFFVMWKSDEGKNKIFIQKIEFWVIFFSPRRRMFADDLVSELICRVSLWSQKIFFCIGREPEAELFQCKHNTEKHSVVAFTLKESWTCHCKVILSGSRFIRQPLKQELSAFVPNAGKIYGGVV